MFHEEIVAGFLRGIQSAFGIKIRRGYSELSNRIATSSTGTIHGRRIIRQLKMLHVANMYNVDDAQYSILCAANAAGANGIVNLKIHHHRGGVISIQGDAVLISD